MEKMKKLLCISLILFAFACASDPQKEMEKAIVGEWCNPYTYQSTGELKGFNFKKGGVCEAINIPSGIEILGNKRWLSYRERIGGYRGWKQDRVCNKREDRSINHRFFMFGCARGEPPSGLFVLEFKGYQRTC